MTNEEIIEFIKKRISMVQSQIDMYDEDEENLSAYDLEMLMRYLYVRNELQSVLSYIQIKSDMAKVSK